MAGFLRRRGDTIERAWFSDRYSAADKGRALQVLGGAVILTRHPYDRSPYSGSGNCWCGRAKSNSLHDVVVEPGAASQPKGTPDEHD